MIKLQLVAEALSVVELPAKDPYPVTQIATLRQRGGDVFRLACSPECAGALRMAEGPVTVEVVTRRVELAGSRAFKLRVVGVVGLGEAP